MPKETSEAKTLSAMTFVAMALEDPKIRKTLNNFPPEFKEIYISRIKRSIEIVVLTLKFLIKTEDRSSDKVSKLFYAQIIKELEHLKTEPDRFRKKYGNDMIETINDAKYSGESISRGPSIDNAIFRLIKWDKVWLTVNTISDIIVSRQYLNDIKFFNRLGKIIAQKSDSRKNINSNKNIILYVEMLGMVIDLKNPGIRKKLHELLNEKEYFQNSKDILPLADFDYFSKKLKRHKII